MRDPRPLIDLSNAMDFHGAHGHAFQQYLCDCLFGPGKGLGVPPEGGRADGAVADAPDGRRATVLGRRAWDVLFDAFRVEGGGLRSPEVVGEMLQQAVDFPRWVPPQK